jgi:16S rRNA (adenine1518-N6/adenine1519-N6)-dimethyltransferase
MARQRLGQHFLADAGWREEIFRAIRVSPQSLAPLAPLPPPAQGNYAWIEIGAGHGEITEQLASTGAPVYAVELDPSLVTGLERFAKRFPNVTVVRRDILETNITDLATGRRLRIYGNLPYYITSPILHHLFASADAIDEIHIVVQFEVAQRLVAEPGSREYGYLSVLTRYFSRPELVLEIPPSAFSPPPEVTSALVTLRLPGTGAAVTAIDQEAFLNFVKQSFAQKRKMLVNNLRSLSKPEVVRAALASLDLRVDARAEQLSVAELAKLWQRLPRATPRKTKEKNQHGGSRSQQR